MKIGDKVVCVDDSPCQCLVRCGSPSGVEKGRVYVVADTVGVSDGLRLILVGRAPVPYHASSPPTFGRGLDANRFRRLEEVKAENALKIKEGVKS